MATLDRLSHTVRDTLDVLAEGWHEVWNKARGAITRFTPAKGERSDLAGNRWALLSAELHESKDEICVEMEVPGLSKEDFEIFVSGGALVVRGRKSAASERTKGRYHITERAYGHFERAFSLPAEVDESGAEAAYGKGVLSIRLPKSRAARPRAIPIG